MSYTLDLLTLSRSPFRYLYTTYKSLVVTAAIATARCYCCYNVHLLPNLHGSRFAPFITVIEFSPLHPIFFFHIRYTTKDMEGGGAKLKSTNRLYTHTQSSGWTLVIRRINILIHPLVPGKSAQRTNEDREKNDVLFFLKLVILHYYFQLCVVVRMGSVCALL